MEGLLNSNQAARYLGLSPATLAVYRSENRGPNYRKLGGKNTIRYSMKALEEYAEHKKIAVPKSELQKREFAPVYILMTEDCRGAPFGARVFNFEKGKAYEVSVDLATVFTQQLKCAGILAKPNKDTFYLLDEGYRQIEQEKKMIRGGKK